MADNNSKINIAKLELLAIERRRSVLLLLLSVSLTLSLFGQDKKTNEDEVIRVDTQLVPIVVTDNAGKPLLNLKESNFIVYEDGKRQELAEFAATAAPFEVALLLDTSGSTRAELSRKSNILPRSNIPLRPSYRST